MIRARTTTDKQDRRLALVSAARHRLANATYAQVALAQVAQDAGLSKASSFTYFPSKEALFLEVLTQELTDWFAHLDARLPYTNTPTQVVELLAASLLSRPVLRHLLAILHTVLEHNVPAAQLRSFKTFLLDHLTRTGSLLAQVLGLPPATGITLLLQLDAILIGIQHLATPAPAVAAVLAEPDMAPLRIDLHAALHNGFTWLIQGALRP